MFKSLATVGSYTMLSRILGFIRDLVVAQLFGASAGTDAFFVAFKIPNFFRRLFAEGAFSMAFVPVLVEYKEKRAFNDLKRFVDHVAGTLGAVLLAVTIVGVLGAPVLAMIFAPGFYADPAKMQLAADMLQITFPYLLFISLTAFAGGILNSHGRFGVPAFTPVLLNISLISCALWVSPQMERPIMALAWGVLLAGIVQLLFQVPFLHQLKLLPRFRFAPKDEGVRRIGKLMLPALFGASVSQLNLLLDTLIASFLVSGSISWLYYSDRLLEFPLGILGVGLATVILPGLSAKHASNSLDGFSNTLDWALRCTLIFGLPSAVGLFLMSGPMIATLFLSDAFTINDVTMAQRSLMAYSLGLMPFLLIKVLVPGYYARQDTKTPVKIAVIAMVSNMALNIALVFPLAHAGLALATSISATINCYLLYRGLLRSDIYRPGSHWPLLILRSVVAAVVMGCVVFWGVGDLAQWVTVSRVDQVLRLSGWIGAGAGAYFSVLFVTGVRLRHIQGAPL